MVYNLYNYDCMGVEKIKTWAVVFPEGRVSFFEKEQEALKYARNKASEDYAVFVAEVKYVTVQFSLDSKAITPVEG